MGEPALKKPTLEVRAAYVQDLVKNKYLPSWPKWMDEEGEREPSDNVGPTGASGGPGGSGT